jgi:hypothetical protein
MYYSVEHHVTWDGKNNVGQLTASGIFYYHLSTTENEPIKNDASPIKSIGQLKNYDRMNRKRKIIQGHCMLKILSHRFNFSTT